tara:strand:+ start:493 stop:1035 length:543 start_codon:yes stop_codon:yes gene_type:complete
MKYLRFLPLLSTIIFVVFININNKNQNTKLRVLIWNTPTLSLGIYLTISTYSGFLLSYITTNIAKNSQTKLRNVERYTYDSSYNKSNQINEIKNDNTYNKTLIERDFNDPLPTINANFRVISKSKDQYSKVSTNKSDNNFIQNESYDESEVKDQEYINDNYDTEVNPFNGDWDDDSYANW